MPKLTVDPRSVLAISPGRLNALRVLEDELQLLRQQSANHPEYLGLMPGMELEIARIRQATGTAAPEPQPEPELPAEPNSLGLVGKSAALVELIQNGGVTAKQAAKRIGSTTNAVAQYVSRIRKHVDIVNRGGVYQIVNQKLVQPAVKSTKPTSPTGKSRSAIIREYAMSHKGIIDRAAITVEHPQMATDTFKWAVNDLKTKHGWEIDNIGGGNYKVIKQGRIPDKPGSYQRKGK